MKLDASRFAVATANVWAAAGLICALAYKAAPEAYARSANLLLHTDMYTATRLLGWSEVVFAILAWWVLVFVLVGCTVALYNKSLVARGRWGRTATASQGDAEP